jgi:hypothetical protein
MEIPYASGSDEAVLCFNGLSQHVNEPSTYFVPTRQALVGMAQLAGFRLVATRVLKSPARVTLLLQAVSRDELVANAETPPFIVQMLKRDLCDNEFRFKQLEAAPHRTTTASCKPGLEPWRVIDAPNEQVAFPQPLRPQRTKLRRHPVRDRARQHTHAMTADPDHQMNLATTRRMSSTVPGMASSGTRKRYQKGKGRATLAG